MHSVFAKKISVFSENVSVFTRTAAGLCKNKAKTKPLEFYELAGKK
jgi:hypothetical protein